MSLLRDVSVSDWNAAARAYAKHGALLESRFAVQEGMIVDDKVPVVVTQVLRVLENDETRRDATVVNIETRVSTWSPEDKQVRNTAAFMHWTADKLCWSVDTGEHMIEALHGRVMRDSRKPSDSVPAQYMWQREDTPSQHWSDRSEQ